MDALNIALLAGQQGKTLKPSDMRDAMMGAVSSVPGVLGDVAEMATTYPSVINPTANPYSGGTPIPTTADIGGAMGADPSSLAFAIGEFGVPDLRDVAKLAGAIPAVAKVAKKGKATDNAVMSDAAKKALAKRIKGDDLLNAQDLVDEMSDVGADISDDGYVTLYHATTPEAADRIVREGGMRGKEDRLYFSTRPDGEISGYGDSVVKVRVPVERVSLDDIFSDEAHMTLMGSSVPIKAERYK